MSKKTGTIVLVVLLVVAAIVGIYFLTKPADKPKATAVPTAVATAKPTAAPTAEPTAEPTAIPTAEPTAEPVAEATAAPVAEVTAEPVAEATAVTAAEATAVTAVEPVAAATVLKLAEVHAPGYPTSLADVEFARLVEEKTNGRIKVETYLGGTLYPTEPASIEALQLGDLAFTRVSASPVAQFVPSINAIQMPYLYKSAAHMWAVLNGEIGQTFLESIEEHPTAGLIGLCYYDAGSRSFYLTKEVRTIADMAGLKIRVQDNQMMKRMVELLGATPVTGIGPNDVHQNITTGVIDGAENNWPTYQNMGDYEAAKFYILDQHTRVPEILLASKAAMAKLSPEDVAIIRECAVDVQQYEIDEWAKKEASSEKIVRDAGTTVVELAPEARDAFAAAMLPLYDEFGADWKDLITQIKDMGKDF